MSSLERITAAFVLLMILSQITERLANFCKYWFSGRQLMPAKGSERTRVRNLRSRSSEATDELERVEGIQFLNILCGWLVAAVGMTILIGSAPPAEIAWVKTGEWYIDVLSVLLAGFFLSFGSKFWHDLLDLLFEVKRAREKVNDPETYTFDRIEDLEGHLKTSASDLAKKAMETKGEELRRVDGVQAVGIGIMRFGRETRSVLEVHVRDEKARGRVQQFAKEVWVEVNGRALSVPVIPILTGSATIMAGGHLGGRIKNSAMESRTGTLGCLVYGRVSRKPFVVSCYHVMRADHEWGLFEPMNKESIIEIGNGEVGTLCGGCRTEVTDTAIAKLPPGVEPKTVLPEGRNIRGWRKLTEDDVNFETQVWFKGANRAELVRARIHAHSRAVAITYPDGEHWMYDLIAITDRSTGEPKCPSLPGDSGSVAFDRDGKAVGMLVAGDDAFGYLIPMHNVLKAYDLDM